MKTLINFFKTLLIVFFVASAFAASTHVLPVTAFAVAILVVFAIGVIDYHFQFGVKNAVGLDLLKQIWIAQLMEKFYAAYPHLARCQDMSMYVNNSVINMADAGVDPDVLINNTTYPIETSEREDGSISLELDTYDTENTVVRNAEAVQLAYPKMESVLRGHRNKLSETCAAKATHAWAPSANSTNTPVFATTGSTSTMDSARKAITIADIAKMKRAFDLLNVPQAGRVLVLHPTHQAELLAADSALMKAFANLKTGEIYTLYGFDIYVSTLTAKYYVTDGSKNAYGASALSTDAVSSLFYHEGEVMKADGDVKMFSRINDPESRGDIVGFQKRFVGLPIRSKFIGSIYSAAA